MKSLHDDHALIRMACVLGVIVGVAGCGGTGSTADPAPKTGTEGKRTVPSRKETMAPENAVLRDNQPVAKAAPPSQPVTPVAVSQPKRNDAHLAELGIKKFSSRRLHLYTDSQADTVNRLPPLADSLYDALVKYFGPLPKSASDFPMTGYLMQDQRLFRETQLLPDDLPGFLHGKHRGTEFWMNEQRYDYYRRHLLLHEATHSFMTTQLNRTSWPPLWYLEGMAELFGTHQIDERGRASFRVLPTTKDGFEGHGRITSIRKEIAAGRARRLLEVTGLKMNDFLKDRNYAWSWSLCLFLDRHPRYRARFRAVSRDHYRDGFSRSFQDEFSPEARELSTEWWLFAHALCHGIDVERFAVTFRPEQDDVTGALKVHAQRGWQSTGVKVKRDVSYRVQADGRFSVAQQPKPWVSEADGVTIEYAHGLPLGCLVGWIDDGSALGTAADGGRSEFQVIRLGRDATFTAKQSGELFLRLNDDWSRLEDNAGHVLVTVGESAP